MAETKKETAAKTEKSTKPAVSRAALTKPAPAPKAEPLKTPAEKAAAKAPAKAEVKTAAKKPAKAKTAPVSNGEIKVELVHSTASCTKRQIKTVKALGLNKLHDTKVHKDNPAIRGMVKLVAHLVTIEKIK